MRKMTAPLRSKLGGHVAGYGIELAFVEIQDTYRDVKIDPGSVRMPHEWSDTSHLNGKVITYNLNSIKE